MTIKLQDYKHKRKARLMVERLTAMMQVFDQFEKELHPYRFYVPAQDVVASIQSNRSFAKIALRRIKEELGE